MSESRLSAARREIIHAYNIVRQVSGEGTIVQRTTIFLQRPLDKKNNNSFVRKVIKEYQKSVK